MIDWWGIMTALILLVICGSAVCGFMWILDRINENAPEYRAVIDERDKALEEARAQSVRLIEANKRIDSLLLENARLREATDYDEGD